MHLDGSDTRQQARRAGSATSSTSGMFTRYVVELDAGGELTVVRQNLETSSQEALEARGRRVRLEWRPEHTYDDRVDPQGGHE